MRVMSTSSEGWASRVFMSGSSECPPARILASSAPPSSSIAWSIDSARAYSKEAGIMPHLPLGSAFASWIARHTRSGDAGLSMLSTPRWETASITAFTTAGGDAIVPASPMPFTPSELVVEGVTVRSCTIVGTSIEVGTRYCVIDEVMRLPDSS